MFFIANGQFVGEIFSSLPSNSLMRSSKYFISWISFRRVLATSSRLSTFHSSTYTNQNTSIRLNSILLKVEKKKNTIKSFFRAKISSLMLLFESCLFSTFHLICSRDISGSGLFADKIFSVDEILSSNFFKHWWLQQMSQKGLTSKKISLWSHSWSYNQEELFIQCSKTSNYQVCPFFFFVKLKLFFLILNKRHVCSKF